MIYCTIKSACIGFSFVAYGVTPVFSAEPSAYSVVARAPLTMTEFQIAPAHPFLTRLALAVDQYFEKKDAFEIRLGKWAAIRDQEDFPYMNDAEWLTFYQQNPNPLHPEWQNFQRGQKFTCSGTPIILGLNMVASISTPDLHDPYANFLAKKNEFMKNDIQQLSTMGVYDIDGIDAYDLAWYGFYIKNKNPMHPEWKFRKGQKFKGNGDPIF